ncbi:MAG: acyl-CoA dehydrogenase family protein [Gammaproteobacteria bacterium]|nr:acyl-CoA dehydrogenase family protein [Gammaproteobacteria bacterium]
MNSHPAAAAVRFDSAALTAAIAAIGRCAKECKQAGQAIDPAIDLVREHRLGAVRVPVPEGGGGFSMRQFFAMLMALADADADVAHILRAHYWFVEERLRSTNREERARWLKRVVAGEIFGNAITEIGGSAAVGTWVFDTKLTPTDGGHVLNGKKYYCTGSRYSDWVFVYAATPSGTSACALVPVNREGVSFEPDDWDGMGQRLTGSGTGTFTNVRVAPDEVVLTTVESEGGAAVQHASDPYLVGQFVQLFLTAVIAGIMRSVVSDAVAHVRKRGRTYSHASAEKAADDPLLQAVIGEIASQAFAAEALILAAADAQDAALATIEHGAADFELTHRASLLAAQAKVIIDELAPRAATQLFDVGGSSAVKRSEDLDRHWRNARTIASHNPTAYKARAIGDYLLNGTLLSTNGFF